MLCITCTMFCCMTTIMSASCLETDEVTASNRSSQY
jgi:hypothetical protein